MSFDQGIMHQLVLTTAQIKYAWPGRRSWSEYTSTPLKYIISHLIARQSLRCSLLYSVQSVSNCDGVDVATE